MGRLRTRDWWDRLFAIGVVLKGIDGLAELTGGLLLLFLEPARIHRFVLRLAQPELSAHPKDFLSFYAALYLLAHGAVKVVLVLALLMNRLWAYPWMIGVLLAFIAYQLYQFAVAPTAGLAALTIFDALVVLLTRHEYGRQRRRQRL